MDGFTIGKLKLASYNLRLIAVESEPNKTLQNCEDSHKLYHDDSIVVIGKFSDVDEFETAMRKKY